MRPVISSFVLSSLCSIILSGCSFQTYRPDELGDSGAEIASCAITKLGGVITRDGIILFEPSGMRSYLSKVTEYGLPAPRMLPRGSKVHLVSLSSGWDSGVGSYIKAKASIDGIGDTYFVMDEAINHPLNRKDFTKFINDGFTPCRK